MKETNLMKRLQVYASKLGARVLRNNNGMAWVGSPQYIDKPTETTLYPGDLVLRKYRIMKFGLGEGSADLIGWQSVTITPEMVGQKIARFTAPEIKTDEGVASDEQVNFIAAVNNAGGRAGLVRNEADLEKLLAPGI